MEDFKIDDNALLSVFDDFFDVYNVTEKDKQELIARLCKLVSNDQDQIEITILEQDKK